MKKKIIKSISMTFTGLATVIVVLISMSRVAKADVEISYNEENKTVIVDDLNTSPVVPGDFLNSPIAERHNQINGVDFCAKVYWAHKDNEERRYPFGDDYWSLDEGSDIFKAEKTYGIIISASIEGENAPEPSEMKFIVNGREYETSVLLDIPNTAYTIVMLRSSNPAPTLEPKKEKTIEEAKPVDGDLFKSEEPYGTVGVANSRIGDLKVHKVNAITKHNQKFLADTFANRYGKKARILTTVSVHPRRDLVNENGNMEELIYSNLENKTQTVYAVCYNQTDKAYYLMGTLDENGVARFPNFILRDATNITIFVLE